MRVHLFRLLFLLILPAASISQADSWQNTDHRNHKAEKYINGDPRPDAPALA